MNKIADIVPDFIKDYLKLMRNKRKHPNNIIRSSQIANKVSLGEGAKINKNVLVCNNVSIGNYSYINNNSMIGENVLIGKYCSIGYDCKIGMNEHPIDFLSTSPAFYGENNIFGVKAYWKEFRNDVIIGNDVWIGSNVIINQGVSIGDGAVLAAGAVITKNVEAYSIVGGLPAKHIRYRFSDDKIKYLLKIRWWDKSIDEIKELKELFLSEERWFDEESIKQGLIN